MLLHAHCPATGCDTLYIALLSFLSAGTGAHAQSALEDAAAAKQFCASPDFKKLTCGLASDAEDTATLKNQCSLCGTLYSGLPTSLPTEVAGVDRYNQQWVRPISLACQGRVVVRSMFKMLQEPEVRKAADWDGTNCTNSAMEHVDEDGRGATPVVRCELELPAGAGSEAERAVKSKESKCWLCGLCSEGKGCPSGKGKWYSDSYTTTATGCNLDASKGYVMHRVGFNINPSTKILLAKFEVCNSGSCFDPAFEQKKLKSARTCTKGVCA